jgi:uncharacterized glyoxalase superfamily protein PhnB
MSQRLVPFLGYEDAAAAIDWLCAAFGAVENAEPTALLASYANTRSSPASASASTLGSPSSWP